MIEEVVVGEALDMDGFYAFIQGGFQGVDVGLLLGGNKYAVARNFAHPCVLQFVQGNICPDARGEIVVFFGDESKDIDFVENHDDRFIGTTDIRQCVANYLDLFFERRM